MIPEIKPHPTWNIIDSTKLAAYMRCPRRYFWAYVLGWRPEGPSLHLDFGRAWHAGMDYLWRNGIRPENVEGAFQAFMKVWNAEFTPGDHINEAKSPDGARRGYRQWVNENLHYAQLYKVQHIEIPGSVQVSDDALLYLKMDLVVLDMKEHQYLVIDHKTTGRLGPGWLDSWQLSQQLGTYIHCLNCLFGDENVWGALINAAIFRKPPRLKKDGTPYANAGLGTEHFPIPVRKTQDQMEQWLRMTVFYMDCISTDMADLAYSDADTTTLNCFPQNPTACTNFNHLCPYFTYCSLQSNPLQVVQKYGGKPPQGFVRFYWDPTVKAEEKEEITL